MGASPVSWRPSDDEIAETLGGDGEPDVSLDPLPTTFTCPHCGAVSANPTDFREGYCGRCHRWTDDD
jgi:hypothetical protein